MPCRLEGEDGRLELEAALRTLGEAVAWRHLPHRQWQHRCDPRGRYERTVVNWYASRGTVVCQGQNQRSLERDLDSALLGQPPTEPEGCAGASDLAACRLLASRKVGPGFARVQQFACVWREVLDAALRQLGEEPSWVHFPSTQQQHRCRPFGRYDQTLVNWYSGTGRIVCQGLNRAALEVHLEKAIRGISASPSPTSELTHGLEAKSFSADGTSAGTPGGDHDLNTFLAPSSDDPVSVAALQFEGEARSTHSGSFCATGEDGDLSALSTHQHSGLWSFSGSSDSASCEELESSSLPAAANGGSK